MKRECEKILKMRKVATSVVLVVAVALGLFGGEAEACNEAVCASIQSKCMLLKSCDCEIKPGKLHLDLSILVENIYYGSIMLMKMVSHFIMIEGHY